MIADLYNRNLNLGHNITKSNVGSEHIIQPFEDG